MILLSCSIRKTIHNENNPNLNKTINQIKNISQTDEIELKKNGVSDSKGETPLKITSLQKLIEICNNKKEIKLKYELENNVNLVKFEDLRIEISFNERLDKNFIKDLTSKLQDWTKKRWIITLSKIKGDVSLKDKLKKEKQDEITKIYESKLFSDLKDKFLDIKLVDIKKNNDEGN